MVTWSNDVGAKADGGLDLGIFVGRAEEVHHGRAFHYRQRPLL